MKNIRLLEDRVSRVAKRLGHLSEEKRQLEEELLSLRSQLETLEEASPAGPGGGDEAWRADKAQVVEAIRETLQELRAD